MLRFFIAIHPPERAFHLMDSEAKNPFDSFYQRLSGLELSGLQLDTSSPHQQSPHWIPKENLHVTLKFIGDFPESNIAHLISFLAQTIQDSKVANISNQLPELRLQGVGFFPNVHAARVVWIGIQGDVYPIKELAKNLDKSLHQHLTIERESRPFSPHITIARVKNRLSDELLKILLSHQQTTFTSPFTVQHVSLFQSILTAKGSIYKELSRFPLFT